MQPTEMRPPCTNNKRLQRGTRQDATYNVVVLAAHGVRAASLRADTDDGEGRTLEADLPGDVPECDTEERQERSTRGGARLEICAHQRPRSQSTTDHQKQEALTLSTLLQHWMGPVLQLWAAARSGSARAMAANRENNLVCVRREEGIAEGLVGE